MESKLFFHENINTGRQSEIDWGRGLAVLFMVLVHVKTELPDFGLPGAYSKAIEFCGGPLAAPVFMALLGVGILYTKNRSPQKLAVRGVKLLAAHYVLNFASFGIPWLIMLIRTGEAAYGEYFWKDTFGIDILAFAGLTFLFFALVERFKLNTPRILLTVLAISCVNYLVTVPVDGFALGAVLGLFVRVNDYAYFPFFSWIGYPVMGYIFGSYLIRCTNKKVFYRYAFAFSALVMAALSLGARKYQFDIWSMHYLESKDYYYQDFIQYILVGGIFFMWISIMYGLSRIKLLSIIGKSVSRWSQNVTAIYFAQWLVIGWLSILPLLSIPAGPLAFTVSSVVIFILSDTAAWLYTTVKKKRNQERRGRP